MMCHIARIKAHLFFVLIWQTVTDKDAKLYANMQFLKIALSFVLTSKWHFTNVSEACGGVCMLWLENLPPSCRSSADAAFII